MDMIWIYMASITESKHIYLGIRVLCLMFCFGAGVRFCGLPEIIADGWERDSVLWAHSNKWCFGSQVPTSFWTRGVSEFQSLEGMASSDEYAFYNSRDRFLRPSFSVNWSHPSHERWVLRSRKIWRISSFFGFQEMSPPFSWFRK